MLLQANQVAGAATGFGLWLRPVVRGKSIRTAMQALPKPLTIGKVARQAGVGVETIRFYEREGLIAEPPRKESGYRQYGAETVSRLRFIQHAKALGFSLKEIKELLFLRLDPGTTCENILDRAEGKIHEIEEKIQTLQRMKKALAALAAACPGQGPISECPIIEVTDDFYEVVHDRARRPARKLAKSLRGGRTSASVVKAGGPTGRQR